MFIFLTQEIGKIAKEVRKLSGIKTDANKKDEIGASEEIADVFIYILSMCKVLNIDLLEAFKNKEKINLKRTWKQKGKEHARNIYMAKYSYLFYYY